MAHSTIIFKHPTFGTAKEAPVGFSWTTFFFGFFPALIRGDYKWALINFVVSVIVSIATAGVGGLICNIVFGVIYNKFYVKELQTKGYVMDSIQSKYTVEQLQAQLETTLVPEGQPTQP
jgi:hypothetical protein